LERGGRLWKNIFNESVTSCVKPLKRSRASAHTLKYKGNLLASWFHEEPLTYMDFPIEQN